MATKTSKSTTSVPSVKLLKRHEKMLDTIRHGTENEAMALFSEEGYDVNTGVDYTFDDRKKYTVTPLAWAVRFKRAQLCKYLLQNGANPYSNLVFDYYPLHEACNRGFDDIVKLFIEMKCDINRVTSDRHTPLHIACMRGNIECARLLLDAGADCEVRNRNGQTPLELGIYHGQSDLCRLFSYYDEDSKPRIQRRHSLHSPTGDHRHLLKQIASVDSSHPYRPQSMLLDYADRKATTDVEGFNLRTLQLPNGRINRERSQSNQNLASGSGLSPSSSVAQPHTCSGSVAPTTSQLQVTPASMNSFVSTSPSGGRPTLIKQFSHASSCAAESPSPVEKDGVLSSVGSKAKSDLTETRLNSIEVQYTTDKETITSELFTVDERYKTLPEVAASKTAVLKDQQYLHVGTSLQPSALYRSKPTPNHSHSNPEFPLMTHISMKHTERTHSYDDLLNSKQKQPPLAEDKISPSREKINSLASQIFLTLDQNWTPTQSSCATGSYQHILKDSAASPEANPVCELMQNIINVTSPLLHFNQAHIQTLMQLSSANCQVNVKQEYGSAMSYSSLKICTSSLDSVQGELVYDSPVTYLQSLGYRLVDKPLSVTFSVPCEGYMTLTFKLIHEGSKEKDAMLKVVTKIFDLKNKYESSNYHSITDGTFPSLYTDISPRLLEISVLDQLPPHPSIVHLVASFKANTIQQHELFAQQMNPENPKKMYTTGRVADFLVLQSPRIHLREHLDMIKKTKKVLANAEVFPERMILTVLSQVLLAVSQLVRNQISHCAVSASSLFLDEGDSNRMQLSNFSHAIQLNAQKTNLERVRQIQLRLKAEIDTNASSRHCVLSPEVVEAVEKLELESVYLRGELDNLFSKNDTYGAALMIYSWFLSNSHSFIHQNRVKPYSYKDIPDLTACSPHCNHLLKKLVAYDFKERLSPMEGAMACFVLIFGPAISDIKTEEDCYKWLLAETFELYLRPVLVDSKVRDYADSISKLLCVYLTVASSNPRGVWEAYRFFSKY